MGFLSEVPGEQERARLAALMDPDHPPQQREGCLGARRLEDDSRSASKLEALRPDIRRRERLLKQRRVADARAERREPRPKDRLGRPAGGGDLDVLARLDEAALQPGRSIEARGPCARWSRRHSPSTADPGSELTVRSRHPCRGIASGPMRHLARAPSACHWAWTVLRTPWSCRDELDASAAASRVG